MQEPAQGMKLESSNGVQFLLQGKENMSFNGVEYAVWRVLEVGEGIVHAVFQGTVRRLIQTGVLIVRE